MSLYEKLDLTWATLCAGAILVGWIMACPAWPDNVSSRGWALAGFSALGLVISAVVYGLIVVWSHAP